MAAAAAFPGVVDSRNCGKWQDNDYRSGAAAQMRIAAIAIAMLVTLVGCQSSAPVDKGIVDAVKELLTEIEKT